MTATSGGLTRPNVITQVRLDLFDTDPANQRWPDENITRQIERALERYSLASPLIVPSQIPTIARSRLYPTPYTAWWIAQVEFPTGLWPKHFRAFTERVSPLAPTPVFSPTFTPSAGPVPAGAYQYGVTFTVPGPEETTISNLVAIATGSPSSITIANLPIGPYGVTGRTLYRTTNAGSSPHVLAVIADNTTTSFTDSAPDSALGAAPPTTNNTAGINQLEIQLNNNQLPQDTTGIIEISAAYKHQLDNNGTSIPERHWDIVPLGAEAYLVQSYLNNVNDNFDYVDGSFRDRVDETKAPAAWQALLKDLLPAFENRLKQARNESDASNPQLPSWGDRPVRWDRL